MNTSPIEEINSLRSRYEVDGLSLRDIASEIGRSPNFVRDRLLSVGVTFDKGARISQKMAGKPSPRRGAKLSDAHIEAIRKGALGNKRCVGRTYSASTIQKMRDAAAARFSTPLALARAEVSKATEAERSRQKRILACLVRRPTWKKGVASLGYSRSELVEHIQGQFSPGMSWDDRSSFTIDHIVPIVEFISRGITDAKIISSLKNLQPLTMLENQRKSARYSGNFETDLAEIIEFNAKKSATAPYQEGLHK